MMNSVEDNIVALVKEHPNGIPLKKLAKSYKKKYHQKLPLSTGVDSVTSLIASLDNELAIVGQNVMYKDNPYNEQVGAHTIYWTFKNPVFLGVILAPLSRSKLPR